jgi:hypothetical protein
LNLEQIGLLINKNIKTIQLKKKNKISKIKNAECVYSTKRNYYTLTSKAQSYLGREYKKSIKVNYYEVIYQDMLIK